MSQNSSNRNPLSASLLASLTATDNQFIPSPAAPGLVNIDTVKDDVGQKTGVIGNEGLTDDLTPTLGGFVDGGAGIVISIYANTEFLGHATIGDDGFWSFTPEQPLEVNQEYIFQTLVKDPGSDEVLISLPYKIYTIETNGDVPATISLDSIVDNNGGFNGHQFTGAIPGDGRGLTDDAHPDLSGKANAGARVNIYDNGTLIGSTTAGADGSWKFTPATALKDGTHVLAATVVTAIGESSPTTGFTITVDTVISQPVIDTVQDNAGNTQGLVSNGGLTDDNRPVLTGHAEAGSRVDIHVFGPGGKELYHQSVTAGNDGSWTYQPEAFTTHGNYSFGITGVDQAGNAWRDYGDKFTVKYVGSNQDADAPDTATNIQVYDDVGTLQGDLANGSTTDDNHPTISGNATAGDLIMISDNGKAIGSVTVDSKGHWSFTPTTALSNAEHSITAVVKDPVTGKVSDATEAFHFTVETQAPLVSGHEYFEGGSDDSTDTLVFASGLQVSNVGDSYLSVISSSFRAEDPNNSKQTILGDNHASGISNQGGEGGILFTLPGAAQTISFDYAVAQSLTIYDTNHNVIAHMVPDYNNGSGSGVIGDAISTDYSWCHFEYTAPQGVTIGSFSVDSGFSWVDNVNWSTSGSTSPWSQSTDINNEAFDLTNHAHNTLALSYNDVITHAEQNLYIQDGKEQFAIKGDNGDVLQLKVADFDHDSWINTGSVSAGVVQYDVYQHAGDNLEMLIQHGVQLHQVI